MTALPVLFAAHKTAVLGAAAAGVAGLALLQRKKATSTTGKISATSPAGTIPAGGVISSAGVQGTYPDTSATDVYNQLEGQLERMQAGQGQAVPVPRPIASTLFAPAGTGNIVSYGAGQAEVESDGSLFLMNGDQWAKAAHSDTPATVTRVSDNFADIPTWFSTAGNLATKNNPTS